MKSFRFSASLAVSLFVTGMMLFLFHSLSPTPSPHPERAVYASSPTSESSDSPEGEQRYTRQFRKTLNQGKNLYRSRCGSCHNMDGSGIPGVYPPHTDVINRFVKVELGRRYLVQVMVNGLTGMITVDGQPYTGAMPNQRELTNEQIAKIANFMFFQMAQDTPPARVKPLTAKTVKQYRNEMITPAKVRELRKQVEEKLQELKGDGTESGESPESGPERSEQTARRPSSYETTSDTEKRARGRGQHQHGEMMKHRHRHGQQRKQGGHGQHGMRHRGQTVHDGRGESSGQAYRVCKRILSKRAPQSNYMHQCSGCHMQNGKGANPSVPPLQESALFARSPQGREFLIRQPFVASAPLSDAQLAEVLTWSLCRYGAKKLPDDFHPFTADEIDRYRDRPLQEVKQRRIELLKKLMS